MLLSSSFTLSSSLLLWGDRKCEYSNLVLPFRIVWTGWHLLRQYTNIRVFYLLLPFCCFCCSDSSSHLLVCCIPGSLVVAFSQLSCEAQCWWGCHSPFSPHLHACSCALLVVLHKLVAVLTHWTVCLRPHELSWCWGSQREWHLTRSTVLYWGLNSEPHS